MYVKISMGQECTSDAVLNTVTLLQEGGIGYRRAPVLKQM